MRMQKQQALSIMMRMINPQFAVSQRVTKPIHMLYYILILSKLLKFNLLYRQFAKSKVFCLLLSSYTI